MTTSPPIDGGPAQQLQCSSGVSVRKNDFLFIVTFVLLFILVKAVFASTLIPCPRTLLEFVYSVLALSVT